MNKRIYFLDNLRTFLIFLVVLLHSGLVYESVLQNAWIVIDPIKNDSIALIRMYLDIFVMFMIFFISGYFIPISVKNKTTKEYIISKFKRIMLPWIVAVFTLIPAYKIIFLYSRGLAQEDWYSYFHIYSRTGSDLSFFANNPVQNWLWFLPILFSFQLLYLALNKSNLLNFKISLKTGVLLVFILGVLYSMIISLLDLKGWVHTAIFHYQIERLLIYFMSFLLGTLAYKFDVFNTDKKNTRLYIISNVSLTVSMTVYTILALNLFFNMIDPERNFYFVSEWADKLLYYISAILLMLSFLHVLLYTFQRYLNKTSKLIGELNQNSYYVYIIHLIVLGLIALGLKELQIPAYGKFFILTVATFILSNLLVSVYNRIFKKPSSNRKAISISIAAIVLSIIVYAKQYQEKSEGKTYEYPSLTETPDAIINKAIIEDDLEAIKQQIDLGSDISGRDNSSGSTPLIKACAFGRTEIALELINAGVDLNTKNNDGSTALHTAAFFCRVEIVKALIENGADQSIRNNSGSTAKETALLPYEVLKEYYEYFQKEYKPLGVELDLERIEKTRSEIAELLD